MLGVAADHEPCDPQAAALKQGRRAWDRAFIDDVRELVGWPAERVEAVVTIDPVEIDRHRAWLHAALRTSRACHPSSAGNTTSSIAVKSVAGTPGAPSTNRPVSRTTPANAAMPTTMRKP